MDTPALPPLPVSPPPGLYRHCKGQWYEVLGTARCSETLQAMTVYRALYGPATLPEDTWVRPAAMFAETVQHQGRAQPRFEPHNPDTLPLRDAATARAVGLVLGRRAALAGHTPRPLPPEPTSCCGRGCQGCVWEGYFQAVQWWREDVLQTLDKPARSP